MKKTPDAAMAQQSLTLPPYGHMHNDFRRSMQLTPVPEGFRVNGRLATADEYTDYIKNEATEMADFLWPIYDFDSSSWVGKATATAVELTEADLMLMTKLHARLSTEVVVEARKEGDVVLVPQRRLGQNQRSLFLAEDTSARGTVDLYLEPLKEAAPALLEAVKREVATGFLRLGATTLRFKELFQRPRPYQVAFINSLEFSYEYGASAVTPALVSGHCLQGLFVRTFATLMHRRALEAHLGAVEAMQRYCIDIGDRRVFAGVHYPSDNLSSWYCALRLCHRSFDSFGQEAKDFMWQAIQTSPVYAAMQSAAADGSPVYKPLLERLQDEARRPA